FTPEPGVGLINGPSVSFVLDGNAADTQTATIVNNVATLPGTAFAAFPFAIGPHTIAVSFSLSGFTPANGTINLQVNKATTTTKVVASPSSPKFGDNVTLTATVTPAGGNTALLAGQTVTFKDGATVLSTGTLDANGVATLSNTFAVGTHS